MDLQKIREMKDEDLIKYLKGLSKRNDTSCFKCGKPVGGYVININNKKRMQQKKLCNLCNNCYTDLLEYLGTNDILWD